MTKFQVGDKVSWNDYEATLMSMSHSGRGYCTLFIHDKSFDGHNGGDLSGTICGYTQQEYDKHCWVVNIDHIRLIEPLCDSGGVIYD